MQQRFYRIAPLGALGFILVLGACRTMPYEPRTGTLPDEVARLSRALKDVSLVLENGDVPPPESRPNPDAPAMQLRAARDNIRALLQTADSRTKRSLRAALDEIDHAWRTFTAGSSDLEHLGLTADILYQAEGELKATLSKSDDRSRNAIKALQMQLSNLTEGMASSMLRRAEAAGVYHSRLAEIRRKIVEGRDAATRNNYQVAVVSFGGAIKLAANSVVFDVELFEQNIIDALAGATTGHAFSIAYQGQLFQGGESSGLARTAADPPSIAQSPSKESHVASVSKTITAILVLRLLEENDLTPEATIAPYLPSNWELGEGVEGLTFKDFMTHRSGFGQNGAGNSYQALRDAIAMDVGSTSFSYRNANFALMRVLVAGLMGIDPAEITEFAPDVVTTSAFLIHADSVFEPIGVEVDCTSTDDAPTIQYKFPDDGSPGYLEPNRQLTCGGFGWFISSNELAGVLTHLRNTEELLSADARASMQADFLGFMDPGNYGFIGGDFGVYYMHGGDWFHGSGQLHACAVAFPIQVEVGLIINSERGSIPYQCDLLQIAFDNAWVAS